MDMREGVISRGNRDSFICPQGLAMCYGSTADSTADNPGLVKKVVQQRNSKVVHSLETRGDFRQLNEEPISEKEGYST